MVRSCLRPLSSNGSLKSWISANTEVPIHGVLVLESFTCSPMNHKLRVCRFGADPENASRGNVSRVPGPWSFVFECTSENEIVPRVSGVA